MTVSSKSVSDSADRLALWVQAPSKKEKKPIVKKENLGCSVSLLQEMSRSHSFERVEYFKALFGKKVCALYCIDKHPRIENCTFLNATSEKCVYFWF